MVFQLIDLNGKPNLKNNCIFTVPTAKRIWLIWSKVPYARVTLSLYTGHVVV